MSFSAIDGYFSFYNTTVRTLYAGLQTGTINFDNGDAVSSGSMQLVVKDAGTINMHNFMNGNLQTYVNSGNTNLEINADDFHGNYAMSSNTNLVTGSGDHTSQKVSPTFTQGSIGGGGLNNITSTVDNGSITLSVN